METHKSIKQIGATKQLTISDGYVSLNTGELDLAAGDGEAIQLHNRVVVVAPDAEADLTIHGGDITSDANLEFYSATDTLIATGDDFTLNSGDNIDLQALSSGAELNLIVGDSGTLNIKSNTGTNGAINLETAALSAGTCGTITIAAGDGSSGADGGVISITSGDSDSGSPGTLTITTGSGTAGDVGAGNLTLGTGSSSGSGSADVVLQASNGGAAATYLTCDGSAENVTLAKALLCSSTAEFDAQVDFDADVDFNSTCSFGGQVDFDADVDVNSTISFGGQVDFDYDVDFNDSSTFYAAPTMSAGVAVTGGNVTCTGGAGLTITGGDVNVNAGDINIQDGYIQYSENKIYEIPISPLRAVGLDGAAVNTTNGMLWINNASDTVIIPVSVPQKCTIKEVGLVCERGSDGGSGFSIYLLRKDWSDAPNAAMTQLGSLTGITTAGVSTNYMTGLTESVDLRNSLANYYIKLAFATDSGETDYVSFLSLVIETDDYVEFLSN